MKAEDSSLSANLLKSIQLETSHLFQRAEEARQKAEAMKCSLEEANAGKINFNMTLFRVRIYDPWDADLDISARQGSVDVTARGLECALQKAEKQHSPNGSPRTDGVLEYHVTMLLPSGDIRVPDDVWQPYSQQTIDSIRKSRR